MKLEGIIFEKYCYLFVFDVVKLFIVKLCGVEGNGFVGWCWDVGNL